MPQNLARSAYLEVSEALQGLDIAVERFSVLSLCEARTAPSGTIRATRGVAFSGFIAAIKKCGHHSVNNIYYKFINCSRSNMFSARIADSKVELNTRESRSDATSFIQDRVIGDGTTR
jgi:hypothetical protein